jgi:hypothetical protein
VSWSPSTATVTPIRPSRAVSLTRVAGSGSRERRVAARVLVVIGAFALLSGPVFAWASPTLFDSDLFRVVEELNAGG